MVLSNGKLYEVFQIILHWVHGCIHSTIPAREMNGAAAARVLMLTDVRCRATDTGPQVVRRVHQL